MGNASDDWLTGRCRPVIETGGTPGSPEADRGGGMEGKEERNPPLTALFTEFVN